MSLVSAYLNFVSASRRKLALVVFLNVLGALFQGASIGLLLPALEIAQNPEAPGSTGTVWQILNTTFGMLGIPITLLTLLLAVLAMIFAGQTLIYAQKHLSASMSEGLVASLRRNAFAAFMRADISFHNSARSGTLTNSLTQDLQRTGGAFDGLLDLMGRAILIAIFIVALFLVSWLTALTAVGVVLVAALLIQYHIHISNRLGRQMVETHQDFHGFTAERIDGVRLVKVSSAEERDIGNFGALVGNVASVRAAHLRRGAQVRLVLEPSLAAGGIVAAYVGLTYFQMSLAQLAVFMYVLIRLVPEVHSVNRTRFNIAGYINHFHEAMNIVQSARQRTSIISGPRSLPKLVQGIQLKNISFSYGDGLPVLRDVNIFLEAGKLTAIIGPSGTGKSTLLDLLVRLVEPTRGKVLLDGTDASEFDLISLRAGISLVSQDILHFNDTVLENIRYGRPDATEEQIRQAATEANAHNFIQELPQGYQTILGPRGMTISGGERQRIALARAILQEPSVLLLDEVTSNLDAESEHLIQESVFRAAKHRTVIVVTHRLSTVEKADKIIVLDQGRVVEEGSPQTLSDINGLYSRHLQFQVGAAKPD